MAVLIEAISIVIKIKALEAIFVGRRQDFMALIPNQTLCMDGDIARIGFMTPIGTENFIRVLVNEGLQYLHENVAQDLVVVDQQAGLMAPCDWLTVGHAHLDQGKGPRVMVASLKDSPARELVTPDQWQYPGSLSQTFAFVPNRQVEKCLHFLRKEDGMDVYFNELTGKEAYTVSSLE